MKSEYCLNGCVCFGDANIQLMFETCNDINVHYNLFKLCQGRMILLLYWEFGNTIEGAGVRYLNMTMKGCMHIVRRVFAGAVVAAVFFAASGSSESRASDDVASGSTSAYSFLEIPTSVQAFSLGGVNISTIDADVTMADQNPALIGSEIGM